MNPYPSYKDSGVEWIEEIPSHWECKRLQHISEIENSGVWGKDEPFEESLPLPIPTTGQLTIEGKWIYDSMDIRYLTKSELNNYKCIEGDIVVVKSSGSSTNIITGKCGYINSNDSENFGFSNFLLRVRPTSLDSKLTYYFLQSNITKQRIERMVSSTTYPNLKVNEYVKSILFIPPPSEQTQIVSFLDTKTQKIDELIEKTEQKIELLKEKRTSLINHCVTKGLNPNVEMKDSGVEWIGEIPIGWDVKFLKFVFHPIREKSETGEEELLSVLIKKGVVKRRDFLGDDSDHLTRSESLVGYIKCSKGNLVNNIMKMGFHCLGISDYDGMVSPGYSVFQMIESNNNPKFWDYLLKTEIYVSEYRKRSKGIQESRMRLYDDYFLSIHSLVPPVIEQTQIVEYLDEQTQKIDSTIEKETQRIELLKEYRQTLISEVVTGKIDVRDWNK